MKQHRRILVLVTLALTGILSLQILLISRAHALYEDRFRRDVADALSRVSRHLDYIDVQNIVIDLTEEEQAKHYLPSPDSFENTHADEEGDHLSIPQPRSLDMRRISRLDSLMRHNQGREKRADMLIEERISMRQVDSLLKRELEIRGLPKVYEFGIIERNTPTVLVTNEFDFNEAQFKTLLFRHDEPSSSIWLYVLFPKKDRFLLTRLFIILGLSMLLMGFLVFVIVRNMNQLLRQKQISRIKTDFINNMTHEFKTPIATISLAVDALNNPRTHSDPERVKYYSAIIGDENRRMNAQVEQVLRLALLDRNALDLNKEVVDLHELIEKAVNHLRLQVETRGGSFRLQLNAEKSIVEVDRQQMVTVFVNLLDNANKYSTQEPHIEIVTQNDSEALYVSISDTGVGMTKDMIEKIFDRFFRQSTGDLHDIKGHGLGLSYAREIISLHEGEIRVTSKPGEGSTFTIKMPFMEV